MGPSANHGITGVLHGCPGLDHNGDLVADLRDRGWNALIFHYRGSWGSSRDKTMRRAS